MVKLDCKLMVRSNSRHLQHLYTGFFLLSKMGIINLRQTIIGRSTNCCPKSGHLSRPSMAHLDVVLNGSKLIHYDTHDSHEIDSDAFSRCDYYFKRSFSRSSVATIREGNKKIWPLGLYYPVFPAAFDAYAVERSLLLGKGIGRFTGFKTLRMFSPIKFQPNIENCWSLPEYRLEPRILFMVRAWDPKNKSGRSIDESRDRESINEMRANCIKLLRGEFGGRFYGGFAHTDFAKKRYGEYLLPDNTKSIQSSYFALLRNYSICVATSGLHGSIGAKFAEYIAFARAIVSEVLEYCVPGDLSKGKNYLEFRSAEECVENAVKLFSDKNLRAFLMRNNQRYYHSYLRPDAQVLRSISIASSIGVS